MKKLLFLALVFSLSAARAQTSYMKLYNGNGSLKLLPFKGDSILVTMGWGPSISLLDPEGGLIRTIHIWEQNTYAPSGIASYTNNDIYFDGGYYLDGDSCITQTLGRIDSSGNIVALNRYMLNGYCPGFPSSEMEVAHDGSVITWGERSYFFALKADPDLALAWCKHFDHHGGFQFIRELPDGDLLAGINMDTAGAVVARLGPDGNFIWCKSYIRKGMVQDCVIESDSSFIITGYTDSIASTDVLAPLPADYDPKLFMMKLNGTGDVQWCKGYFSGPRWYARRGQRIVKGEDGNYTLLANIGVPSHYMGFQPFLMKVDQNGDTIWTRSFGMSGYAYETEDMLASSNGGCIFSGALWGNVPPPNSGLGFIYKTDSMGHLPCSEHSHPVEVLDLFPADSSFTLTSVDGATSYPAFMQDTTFADVTVYDGCTFATNIPPSLSHTRPPKVHPNPSTGRFTVSFNDPLTVDSFYSVYDAMGKLLFQRPLTKGEASEEIDLSRYGKGMYLIRFTDRDGVCAERVVVE